MLTAIQRPLRAVVNTAFHGKDPYQVLRATAFLVLFVRLYRKLKKVLAGEGLRAFVLEAVAPLLKKLPPVQRQLEEERAKVLASYRKKFSQHLSQTRAALPATGIPEKELLELMSHRAELDTKSWQEGKITGAVYHGQKEHCDFIGQIAGRWAFSNPLHPGIHPAMRQMDSEVIQMVVNLYNGGEDCCGAFTTGGTESILLAMKTYRDWGRAEKGITDPNIVVCTTAHAAFMKAGKYFNIGVRFARTGPSMEVDVRHMGRLVDGNTVAIVGSACQYAHGTVDPISQLAALALRRRVGLHVDCCLGGFLVPFMDKAGFPLPEPVDFRVKGVTSISCDPHKYGFSPKGASVVMFSSRALRRHMYCYLTEWSGGIYATAAMTGSRAGGVVAATWAAMCKLGEEGYVESTRQIVGATRAMAKGVQQIEGLELVGRPDVCVFAFAGSKGSGINCYALADAMLQRSHWELQTCQKPPCVHFAVTLPSSRNVDLFLADLKEAVAAVKENPKDFTSSAGMYGMAASLPTSFIEEAAATYIDATMDAIQTADGQNGEEAAGSS